MADDRNINEQEQNEEQQEQIENPYIDKTEQELFEIFGDKFYKYYLDHRDNFKNTSLGEIFLSFVNSLSEDSEQKTILKTLEEKLGREITVNDIKNLYLKGTYTLEGLITKDIFKKFKRKKAVLSVVRTFENKINKLLSDYGLEKISFKDIYDMKIEKEEDVDKVFENVKSKFLDLKKSIKNLLNNDEYKVYAQQLLEKLKKVKVLNEEILQQMEKDGVINENEKKALMFDTKNGENDIMNGFDDKVKEELLNIVEVLANSSILNTLYDVLEVRDKMSLEIEKFKKLPHLGSVLKTYILKLDKDYIDKIWNQEIGNDYTKLPEKYQKDFEKCKKLGDEGKKVCEFNVKKNFVLEYIYSNEKNFLDYMREKVDNKNLLDLLEKLLNKNYSLTEEDLKNFFEYIKNDYVENVVNFFKKAYKFSEDDKQKYKDLLSDILDPNKDKININGKEINIEKKIAFDKTDLNGINDLFDAVPRIKLIVKGDNVNFFENIFPQYFDRFLINNQEKTISNFSKVNVKTKDGKIYNNVYIRRYLDGKIDIYKETNGYDDAIKRMLALDEPDEQIDEKNIENIDVVEAKLDLSDSDIPKLALGLISALPNRGTEQSINRIKQILKDKGEDKKENILSNEEKIETSIDDVKKEWNKFEGDEQVEFEKGNIIQFRGETLGVPGLLSNWYYGEIVDIDEKQGTFTLKMIGGGLLPLDDEGKEIKIPLSGKVLKKIRYSFASNTFKFKKLNSISEFAEYVNGLNLKSDIYGFKTTLGKWTNSNIELEEKGGKLYKKEGGEKKEIKYIGKDKIKGINVNEVAQKAKSRSELYDVWEIEYKGNKVILKDPDNSGFKKTIDLNTFLTVILHNNLEPWTENEYKDTKFSYVSASKPKGGFVFALNDFILAGKNLKDAFLYHFKQDDELRAAEVYATMTKAIPGFWFLEDIKSEALAQKEGVIWKLIQNAKSRLEREGDNTGKNHAKTAADVIEKEVFSLVKKGKELSTRKKMKAAGYLLYALEKGPGAYFRKLGKYAGQGMWIRALLGQQHYYTWLARVKDLENKLKNDPDNQDLRNDLVLSEMFYIKEVDTRSLYSAKFSSELEVLAIDAQGSMGMVKKSYDQEMGKGDFSMIYSGLKSYITNNRAPNSLGALQALSERVEVHSQYVDYYKAILLLSLTGYVFNFYSTNFRENFDKLCRTYSTPIGLFARQQNGIVKILHILDYIVKKKGIKILDKEQSFTEYVYGVKNPEDINIYELKNTEKIKEVVGKIEEFWKFYGEEIVSALDYSTSELFEYKNDEKITEKERLFLDEYFSKVNESAYGEKFEYASDLFQTSYAPYWQNGILNVHTGVFKQVALDIEHGKFENDKAAGMWEGLTQKLDTISDFMSEDSFYNFILEKFIAWFGGNYRGENEINLVKALLSGKKTELNSIIKEFLIKSVGGEEGVPPEVEEGFEQFVNAFSFAKDSDKPKNLKNILKNKFGEKIFLQAQFENLRNIEIKPTNNEDYNPYEQQAA